MQEIKGIGMENGLCAILTMDGEIHKVGPTRLTVHRKENDCQLPCFDSETGRIVCGTEKADAVLTEMLTLFALGSGVEIPGEVFEDPVAEQAAMDWITTLPTPDVSLKEPPVVALKVVQV